LRKLSIAAIAVMSVALVGCGERANGDKVGMITKVAKQGWWCPTWEASIQRGGFNAGTGVSGAAFEFTIEDPKLLKQVQDAMEQNLEVKITYRQEIVTFCRSESDDHFLTGIQVIGKSEAASIVHVEEDKTPAKPAVTYPKLTKEEAVGALIQQNQQLIDIIKGM
jgi:uncharacterized lipoprotein NlpE involved in copper resistance